ncbi:hypothetical protein WJX74_000127 [Apatococcus lobatus]|uniref:Methyltransferase domain-containing protein n=1 Tax=Apatococcus lobatus TaxID=904363 RepID=A0AAW1QD18_9CHLO
MSGSFGSLLPDDFEQFREVTYWDGFFKSRKQKAFEWYGEFQQLRLRLLPLVADGRSVLMAGCGNSDLSANLYDAGCQNITNIDFSKICIREMMTKNLRHRPHMKWLVMDMTATKFGDGSFDVVLDKGGLDALMGEDTEGANQTGSRFLAEVARLVSHNGGLYVCVSLAQPHVLRKLLASFGEGWRVEVYEVPPSMDMLSSPLQPFLFLVHQTAPPSSTASPPGNGLSDGLSNAEPIKHELQECPTAVNAEQLSDILQILREENAARSLGLRNQQPQPALPGAQDRDADDNYDSLHPGQRITVELPLVPHELSAPSSHNSGRFSATVMDVEGPLATSAAQQCAVFLVPQGREHEWLFLQPEGQAEVAASCQAKRLIIVSCKRGQTYGTTLDVQQELSPMVLELAPASCRGVERSIPIMTTDDGIGSRMAVAAVTSALSGLIQVEDVTLKAQEGSPQTFRRMVFASTPNLIQSEAYLVPQISHSQPAPSNHSGEANVDGAPNGSYSSRTSVAASGASSLPGKFSQQPQAANGKAKSRKNSKLKKKVQRSPAAAAEAEAADTQRPEPSHAANGGALMLDTSRLACAYHHQILVSLALIGDSICMPKQGSQQWPRALVIGVGGGSLPLFLARHMGFQVDAVELDPVVLDLAQQHFAFGHTASLQGRVADGLDVIYRKAQAVAAGDHQGQAAASHEAGTAQLRPSVAQSCTDAYQAETAAGPASSSPAPDHSAADDTAGTRVDSSSVPSSSVVTAAAEHRAHATQSSDHDSSTVVTSTGTVDMSEAKSAYQAGCNGRAAQAEQVNDAEKLHLIVVDASSGDASLAMTCPPAAFVEQGFLRHAAACLRPEGVLAINFVTRSRDALVAAYQTLQEVFPAVYTVSAEDDVNFVMLATGRLQPQQQRTPKQHAAYVSTLQKQWSKLAAAASDRHKLAASYNGDIHAAMAADIEDAIERSSLDFNVP